MAIPGDRGFSPSAKRRAPARSAMREATRAGA